MRTYFHFTALASAILLTGCPAQPSATSSATPVTDDDKTFYALGLSVGQQLKIFSMSEAELKMVERGMEDQVLHRPALVELREWGQKISVLANSRRSAAASGEKQKGAAALAAAEKEPGAKKTASGLVYIEQKAGTGESPKATDVVKVNYRGTLQDGTEFDSSFKRNQPAEFPLNGVIRCWTEGVQMMKVGGKAKLVCPSDLAYGDSGTPPAIPGGATLTFEVELLEIKPTTPPPGSPAPPAPAPTAPGAKAPPTPPPPGAKAPPPAPPPPAAPGAKAPPTAPPAPAPAAKPPPAPAPEAKPATPPPAPAPQH